MARRKPITPERIAEVAQEEANRFLGGLTEDDIRNRVHSELSKSQSEIIAKALGLNYSWGRWEVDHCNRRIDNSTAGALLRSAVPGSVEAWLAEAGANITSVEQLSATARKQIAASYREAFERYAVRMAAERGERDAARMVDEVIGAAIAPAATPSEEAA